MRFGRPRPCKAGTTEEMEAQGYVGLYLRETRPLMHFEVECPTPDWLLEPPPTTTTVEEKAELPTPDIDQRVKDNRDDLLRGWFT